MEPILLRLEPVATTLRSAGVLLTDSDSGLIWLGLPDRSHRVGTVLVAGTNGKGSTVAFTEAILRSAGKKTGAYLSPCLLDPGDSTWINGVPVGSAVLLNAIAYAEKLAGNIDHLTNFERWTVATFICFVQQQVEWAVIEVGLGGRLDATNVIDPDVSVITNVALDHTKFLGTTVEEIAWEKGGIIRKHAPLVTGLNPNLYAAAVRHRSAPSAVATFGTTFVAGMTDGTFWYRDDRYDIKGASLGIGGRIQAANAAQAVAACRFAVEDLTRDTIVHGLKNAKLAGRWEVVPFRPTLVLDGAHNEAGAQVAARELASATLPRPWVWLWACRKDRDPALMTAEILPFMDRVVATSVPGQHMWEAGDLIDFVSMTHSGDRSESVQDPLAALQRARTVAGSGGTVFVIGSLYLIGAVYRHALVPPESVGDAP